ncbi:GNAT family N-acetyltransferase [Citricoccus nitrophenolicus]|uniref:GNAT family N-acetyltransferase n=1 Tax=Citricoccus nitrophenolicus TaxID=863575 RepID=UPI003CD05423
MRFADAHGISAVDLQHLTVLGWPAVESQEVGGWTVRFSSGITRRANSVVSTEMPADVGALDAAVDEVERRSAERWLSPTFQLWQPASGSWLEGRAAGEIPDAETDAFYEGQQRLGDLLDRRGYQEVAPTKVLWMDRSDVPSDTEWDRRILVSETLSENWLSASLRSGDAEDVEDQASRLVRRRLLGGGRSRFYSCLDAEGQIGGGAKLSLVTPEGSGRTYAGIYALWVRDDLRGQGLSASLLDAIFNHLVRLDVSGCWLQVEERSARALGVYRAAGFSTVAQYRYLTHLD